MRLLSSMEGETGWGISSLPGFFFPVFFPVVYSSTDHLTALPLALNFIASGE
jgi:hypothetical protein